MLASLLCRKELTSAIDPKHSIEIIFRDFKNVLESFLACIADDDFQAAEMSRWRSRRARLFRKAWRGLLARNGFAA